MSPDRTNPPPPAPPTDPAARSVRSTEIGEAIDQGRGRIFPCEGCGADLEFNIGQQRLKCPYCGYERELVLEEDAVIAEQDFHAALARLREHRAGADDPPPALNEVRCESCGANVVFHGTLTSSSCPFCDSPIQREGVHRAKNRITVDAVLPFRIEQPRAKSALSEWVKSRWFAPNEFLERGAQGKFSGVYVPFWTYDSLTFTLYSGQRGEHYWVTVGSGKNQRRERRTRWYPASGRFQRFFDDVLILADRALPRHLLEKLEPWPLGTSLPFTEQVLAGYLAKTYDIELDAGFVEARKQIDAAIRGEVRARIGGDEQRIHRVDTDYQAITYKHLLLPVWLLAYKFRGKTYRVAINGATGEVQGERPYSWVKILLAVLGIGVFALVVALMSGVIR